MSFSPDHRVTLRRLHHVTHDVVHAITTKPEGFGFQRGQAVDWALDRRGFRDNPHPFTMVSGPEDDHLEFVIKCYPTSEYPDHEGVTEQIEKLVPGAKILISEPFGGLEDKGEGVFIAGGAGITPFISMLEAREKAGALGGCALIFSNKAEKDIILRERWEAMAKKGLQLRLTLTDEDHPSIPHTMVTGDYLKEQLGELTNRRFYVCGPPPMMEAVIATLRQHRVPDFRIIAEEWWLEG